jgi:hypothetical protein
MLNLVGKKYFVITDRMYAFLNALIPCNYKRINPKLNEKTHDICRNLNKGNNKITELRTILQRESQNS